MKKILIHYPYIPHYRVPIFELLAESEEYDFVFLSSTKDNPWGIKSEGSISGREIEKIKLFVVKLPLLNKEVEFDVGVVRALLKHRPDVYMPMPCPNNITSWFNNIVAKLIGCKCVFWTQGTNKVESGLKLVLRKIYMTPADALFLYGDRAKELMAGWFNNKPLVAIYNSLDYEKIAYYRDKSSIDSILSIKSKMNIKKESFVLVTPGRLCKKGEIDKAIKLVADLRNELDIHLIIIGDGEEKEALQDLVNSYSLNCCVHFTGAVYDESALSELFLVSNYCFIPGRVGLAAMHSLSYGIPLITHDVIEEHCPEIEAVVDGLTGYYFEKNNDVNMKEVILNAYENELYGEDCVSIIEAKYTPLRQKQFIISGLKEVIND